MNKTIIISTYYLGNLLDETEVLEWMVKQKNDESIEEIDRETLLKYIETKEFLAVIFCKEQFRINVFYAKIASNKKTHLMFFFVYFIF